MGTSYLTTSESGHLNIPSHLSLSPFPLPRLIRTNGGGVKVPLGKRGKTNGGKGSKGGGGGGGGEHTQCSARCRCEGQSYEGAFEAAWAGGGRERKRGREGSAQNKEDDLETEAVYRMKRSEGDV
jgi:hypothetical protein